MPPDALFRKLIPLAVMSIVAGWIVVLSVGVSWKRTRVPACASVNVCAA